MKDPLCLVPEEADEDQPFHRDLAMEDPVVTDLIAEIDHDIHRHVIDENELKKALRDIPIEPTSIFDRLA